MLNAFNEMVQEWKEQWLGTQAADEHGNEHDKADHDDFISVYSEPELPLLPDEESSDDESVCVVTVARVDTMAETLANITQPRGIGPLEPEAEARIQ